MGSGESGKASSGECDILTMEGMQTNPTGRILVDVAAKTGQVRLGESYLREDFNQVHPVYHLGRRGTVAIK